MTQLHHGISQGPNKVSVEATRVRWKDVLAAIQDDERRTFVVSQIRGACFQADDFSRSAKCRQIACDALVALEDRLEPMRGSMAAEERDRIRYLRRRLELELHP